MNQEMNDNWIKYIESYQNEEIKLEDVQEKYAERVKDIVEYAQKNSNFYSKHLQTRNGESSKVEALSGIPYTTKDDLREVLSEICCLPYDEIGTYYETTGTTGKPTPCPRGIIDINTSGAYVKKALKEVYQETFGTTHALTAIMGPCELYAFGDTYGEVCRSLDIPFVRLWPESPRVGLQKAADLVTKLEVKSMICSPAIALALSRLYKSMGIDPRETTIKQIFVLGELCTPEMLANISRIWNANCTHGLYGAQEVFAVATGYPDGKLYFSETNYIAEILPVEGIDESIGELCLTMLVPGAKPLIRFRTGDLASFQEATGKYHNQSRTIQIMGRVNDIVTINNRNFCPSQIESAIMGATEWIYGYKVDIRSDDNGRETLEVSIVADLGNRTVKEVEQKLADFFNISVKLNLVTKLDQRTETGAYISWKHARIRDWRNEHA